ncbi:hypothetical protein Zm00014a_009519 [Zea mays]|uniref:Uncharacterized protein n=1 Tax=Zea mays TaxID=4577 RepID=A0A3L6DZ63_MAIZE|nr:hypothetical protein Zm00014a_009519 [Zea mays]
MVLSWLATTEFGRYDVLAGSAQYRRKRPLVSVDVGEVHEWRGLALVQLPRVRHPLRGATAGAGARAVVLAEEHGLLPGGVVPVVPSRGRDDGGEVRPGEDDGSVGAPRPTQPHLPRAHDVAVHERQARPLGERRTPVRRDAPRDGAVRGGVGDGADGAAEVEGARVAEDKVDGALDVAAAEEVAALLVQQRVLGAVEAAPVEGGLVAPDAQRHRLAARVPRVGGASRVLDADVVGHEVGGEDGDGGAVEGAAGGVGGVVPDDGRVEVAAALQRDARLVAPHHHLLRVHARVDGDQRAGRGVVGHGVHGLLQAGKVGAARAVDGEDQAGVVQGRHLGDPPGLVVARPAPVVVPPHFRFRFFSRPGGGAGRRSRLLEVER